MPGGVMNSSGCAAFGLAGPPQATSSISIGAVDFHSTYETAGASFGPKCFTTSSRTSRKDVMGCRKHLTWTTSLSVRPRWRSVALRLASVFCVASRSVPGSAWPET